MRFRGQLSSGLGRAAFPDAILAVMRRPLLALLIVLAGIGVFAGGLAWLLDSPRPAAGASHAERLYLDLCSTCHGADGRGSWRAALFLIRPGNLADAASIGQRSDEYLFDIIKHGGAPIGRPGMPGFGATISDADITELVRYVRGLTRPG
jgi:mono/diheme cytochrome c family protein